MPDLPEHSDISLHGWIGSLSEPWRSYALLMRLDRPAGTWLLFQPCAFGVFLAPLSISFLQRIMWLFIFFAGSWTMRSSGCIINDLWDRNFDALVERTKMRPLASGAITPAQAIKLLALLLFISLILLLLLPPFCWGLGIIGLLLTGLYPTAKRFIDCPQLVLGITFGFGALISYASIMNAISIPAVCLYVGVIFWQIGYDTIYGFQDIKDDQKIGVKSASLLMQNHAKLFISSCYLLTSSFFLIAAFLEKSSVYSLLGLFPGIFWLFFQVIRLNPKSPALCLYQFNENVSIGWVFSLGWIFVCFYHP
ncbi:4-hydroxybenzoate polyprenyltransferase [Acetobacteraceae bacterium]|nr:4-hydroxybenzoate polyprenyltransferase [Acetobacteraceae bacterium]